MRLTRLEREVLTDSMLKIQSIQAALSQIDPARLADHEKIHKCLATTGDTLRLALKDDSSG